MSTRPDEPSGQLRFLAALVESNASIAGDILQIGECSWAIHGSIPVDGDVLVARYDSLEEASGALASLAGGRQAAQALPPREW